MLKSLELAGFKSFADRTRFEFDRGITAVVGPNGSGKSNVVDAIKWVLGEQSAKSLRGREMADCIFNGSGTRRSQGMAEVTLTFDNRAGLLPLESDEVAITRRVYRTGEGEYLINRQPARLRDIREMLLGTGAATEAYSVIEQGKVDVLLQASTKERRVIFEEAAGISRFRMKKADALRKLDRARQNLLRIDDVLEEVQRQLRSVRQQSARARRHQEYTNRLRALRLALALSDYRAMAEELDAGRSGTSQLQQQGDALSAQMLVMEEQSGQAESHLRELESRRLSAETRLAEGQRRIDSCHSTIEHQRQRESEWQQELRRYRNQWVELIRSAEALLGRQREAQARLGGFEEEHTRLAEHVSRSESQLAEFTQTAAQKQRELDQGRERLMDLMRRSSALSNERAGFEARQNSLQVGRDRLTQRLAQSEKRLEQIEAEWQRIEQQRAQTAARLDQHRAQLRACHDQRGKLLATRERIVESLGVLGQRRSAATERAAVLRDLQERQEGLGQGVQQALAWRRRPEPGVWAGLRGVLADLVEVDIEHAPLIEVALGTRGAYLVFGAHAQPVDLLIEVSKELKGRAGVAVVAGGHVATADAEGTGILEAGPDLPPAELAGTGEENAAKIHRADRLVRASDEIAPLVRQLLGDTWVVPDLATALRLRDRNGGRLRWVTLNGELVNCDGTVELGPAHTTGGLISRNSELRELQQQISQLGSEIEAVEAEHRHNQSQLEECESAQQLLQQHVESDRETLTRQQAGLEHAGQQLDQIRRERDVSASELVQIDSEFDQAVQACQRVATELDKLQQDVEAQNESIAALERQLDEAHRHRQEFQSQVTAAKVEWAKGNERLQSLEQELRQIEQQRQQQQQSLEAVRRDIALCRQRIEQATRDILKAQSQQSHLYLAKEELARLTAALEQQRQQQREQRDAAARELAELRRRVHDIEEQRHAQQLHVSKVAQRMKTLVDRMHEDYEVDLAEIAAGRVEQVQQPPCEDAAAQQDAEGGDAGSQSGPEGDQASTVDAGGEHFTVPQGLPEGISREQAEQEIEGLRRKIAGLGAVNLEALRELEELETRSGVLTHQHADLLRASATQEEILRKINQESRKLFANTLDAVRGHFEDLFRKLFGGGRADIVLEDEEDLLESGIEIIARPPGKEPRSISQLSGGEKTLTAVAILLAIFRSRPSPFCVLDEVDAALDEGNVDRFVVVLNEFLSWTQFILITHCKRTMTCAGVLYGITMQESGVSKRVAVRFEDVHEDGRFDVRPDSQAEGDDPGATERQGADVPRSSPGPIPNSGPHWNRQPDAGPEQVPADTIGQHGPGSE